MQYSVKLKSNFVCLLKVASLNVHVLVFCQIVLDCSS